MSEIMHMSCAEHTRVKAQDSQLAPPISWKNLFHLKMEPHAEIELFQCKTFSHSHCNILFQAEVIYFSMKPQV